MGTARQELTLSNRPSDMVIRTYLFDYGRVDTEWLWVMTHGCRVNLVVEQIDFTVDGYWVLNGKIFHFQGHRELVDLEYSLFVGMGDHGHRRNPIFTVANIPTDEELNCQCCNDGTKYSTTDVGYWCPKCHHSRPPIHFGEPSEVHGTYPPYCPRCETMMQWVELEMTCKNCNYVMP